jgi:hypothetical protein
MLSAIAANGNHAVSARNIGQVGQQVEFITDMMNTVGYAPSTLELSPASPLHMPSKP